MRGGVGLKHPLAMAAWRHFSGKRHQGIERGKVVKCLIVLFSFFSHTHSSSQHKRRLPSENETGKYRVEKYLSKNNKMKN
jgi:hypothetical protein